MQYLAPRQGLFAVIILVSFCCHVLFFVISGENKAKDNHAKVATTLANELSQELALPLAINDRVSASVIANRYINNPAIAYIGVYDHNERLLVPVGNENDNAPITHNVMQGDKSLGQIVIHTTSVSRAGLIAQFWLFLLISALLHAMIWMIYGYIARPSDELAKNISKQVRDNLVASGIVFSETSKQTQTTPSEPKPKQAPITKRTVNEFLQSISSDTQKPTDTPSQSTDKAADTIIVQIAFLDKHHLFNVLGHERHAAYLALCDQLLQKMANRLLTRPVLAGVQIKDIYPFEFRDGVPMAAICFNKAKDKNDAKIALAGAMLAKLIPLVNQVVYERHRELNEFALPMKAIVTDDSRADAAWILLQKYQEQSLALLNATDTKSIADSMNLVQQKRAGNIYERECRILTAVHDDMAAQLIRLRNDILIK